MKESQKINRELLFGMVSARTGISSERVSTVIDTLIEVITKELVSGNEVPLRGLGSFKLRHAQGGTVTTPLGDTVEYGSSMTPVFKVSTSFRRKIKESMGE